MTKHSMGPTCLQTDEVSDVDAASRELSVQLPRMSEALYEVGSK